MHALPAWLLLLPLTAAPMPQALKDIERAYGIEVLVLQAPHLRMETKYRVEAEPADDAAIRRYALLFASEWNRYPASAIRRTGLTRIIIGKALRMNGQERAAVPAFESKTMYYDTSLGAHNPAYQRSVIHHEFFHLIDHRMGTMRKDPTWQALNAPGFQYGDGGHLMRQRGVGNLTNLPGLLTSYAGSAIEEDKAELYAHLLTNRKHVESRAQEDAVLKSKVGELKRRLASWDRGFDAPFWVSEPRQSLPCGRGQ